MTLHQHAHHPDDHDHHDTHGSHVSDMQLRMRALETVLTEKGYIDPKALDVIVDAYENRIGTHSGPRIVPKPWADPEFKLRLLADATVAISALGIAGRAVHLIA